MTLLYDLAARACLVGLLLSCACSSKDSSSPGGAGGGEPSAGESGAGESSAGGSAATTGGTAANSGGKGGSGGSAVTSGGKNTGGASSSGGSNAGNGDYLIPNPLVCRKKTVESSPDGGDVAFDGEFDFSSTWRAPTKSWVKINIGKGPSKLLFVWHTAALDDYTVTPDINFGAPTAYVIEVSATGADGSWTKVAEVTGAPDDVTYDNREHAFDFTGMSYVRWTLNKLVSGQGNPDAQIDEIEIHDISNGSEDTWAVVGLGQARGTYDGHTGLFPELVNKAHPDYYPALVDLAEAGGEAKDLVGSIDKLLELNPDFHFWILAYGVGDASNDRTPADTDFKQSMQKVIDKLKAAGKVPLIPRIEKIIHTNYANVAQFNTVIDQLVKENALPAAPDLYDLFSKQPELFCSTGCETDHEGLEFSPEGDTAVNALWASAIDPLYAP